MMNEVYLSNKSNKMAEGYVQDELTRLRLKLLEQKIRGQSSGSNYGNIGVYGSPTSSNSGIQQMLQAETLKSQQLLERVKEERHYHKRQTHGRDDDHTREMMTMMMSQNMQLQQMMLQQLISPSTASRPHPTEKTTYPSLSTVQPAEIEQIGQREMTPFTSLPRDAHRADSAHPAPKLKPPVPVQRKPSPKPQVQRGVATPVRPTERLPAEPQTRPPPSLRPEGFIGQVTSSNPEAPYPFPGTRGARKLRHYGYVAWACFILISLLKKVMQRRHDAMESLNNVINQAIDELHRRHFLERDGAIYATIQDAVKEDAFDLKVKNPGIFQRLSQDSQATISELSSMIETIVYNVIRIKPLAGILSATREGVLWQMTQVGALLPADYLWEVEEENVRFTERGELTRVTNQMSTMFLLGLFISRGLVSTLLLKPTECGLMENDPSPLASSNLKVLASILMRIVREVSLLQKKKIMPLASEISSQLFSDEDMKYIYKKIDDAMIWSKANLKRWTEAYVDSVNTVSENS